MKMIRCILGLDPGLRHTGWGLIRQDGNRLSFLGAGRINPPTTLSMAERLNTLYVKLQDIIDEFDPDEASLEETFVNKNATSALKLGQARGVALLAAANRGLSVAEYSANKVKQCVVGYGHADKGQIQSMVGVLLPSAPPLSEDAADALAVAITHAHHRDCLLKDLV